MRTWPVWLKATLAVCLAVLLATPAIAGEQDAKKEEKKTSAVVVIKKSENGGATKTIRVVRSKDGRWVAEDEASSDRAPSAPGTVHAKGQVRVRLGDGDVKILEAEDIQIQGPAKRGGMRFRGGGGKGPQAGRGQGRMRMRRAPPMAGAAVDSKAQLGPLHTVLRYMMEKHSAKKLTGCPLEAWFAGDNVPMQGLRDAFVEDGWTAPTLKAWLAGRRGPTSHAVPTMPHAATKGTPPPMPSMQGPVAQTRTIVMWHDGTQWRRHEVPMQQQTPSMPWGMPHPYGPTMHHYGYPYPYAHPYMPPPMHRGMMPLHRGHGMHPGYGSHPGHGRGGCNAQGSCHTKNGHCGCGGKGPCHTAHGTCGCDGKGCCHPKNDRCGCDGKGACHTTRGGRSAKGGCGSCNQGHPKAARRAEMRIGLGLPDSIPEHVRELIEKQIAESLITSPHVFVTDGEEEEEDPASALLSRLLPSVLIEGVASSTGSKCDTCPNKGKCADKKGGGSCADVEDADNDGASKCDTCPNKGKCGEKKSCDGCPNKGKCGDKTSCDGCPSKGKCGEKKDCSDCPSKKNAKCDCPCNGACGGDCDNCPIKQKMKKEAAAEKECCGSCQEK